MTTQNELTQQLRAALLGESDYLIPALARLLTGVIPLQRSIRACKGNVGEVAIAAREIEKSVAVFEDRYKKELREGKFYQLLMDARLAVEANRESDLLDLLTKIMAEYNTHLHLYPQPQEVAD